MSEVYVAIKCSVVLDTVKGFILYSSETVPPSKIAGPTIHQMVHQLGLKPGDECHLQLHPVKP
jgi:hypothetical protein